MQKFIDDDRWSSRIDSFTSIHDIQLFWDSNATRNHLTSISCPDLCSAFRKYLNQKSYLLLTFPVYLTIAQFYFINSYILVSVNQKD